MQSHEISFNSLAELDRKIEAVKRERPQEKLDDTQIDRSRARANKMDNDDNPVGERVTVKIDYTRIRNAN